MTTELATRRFRFGREGLVAGACVLFLTLEPQIAQAAGECGSAVSGGTVTCSSPTYPSGITYNGTSGLTVNVVSGTSVISAGGSGAIDLEGTGPLALNALNASATGSGAGSTFSFSGPNFRPGMYYGVLGYSSNGPVALTIGQASTAISGSAVGIGGYSSSGAVAIQTTHVQQTGLAGVGINAEGASVSVAAGQIDATLRGIVAFGDAGGVTVNSGTINVIDNSMFTGIGIQADALSGQGDISITSGSINASGSNGVGGISTQSATLNGTTTIVSGSITAIGLGQYGILSIGPSAVDITSTGTIRTNGGPRFVNDAKSGGGVQNDPRFAAGIWVMDPTNGVSVKNQGSIVTTGDEGYGIRVETGTQITSIPDSSGQPDSKPITITSTSISTGGQGADGIYIASDQSAVTLTSGTVKTTGAGSDGININSTGGPVTVTSTDAEVASGNHEHAISINNTGGPVTLTSGTTSGAIDIAVLAVGDASVTSTSATSTGDVGIAVESLGKVTVSSQSVAASGAGASALIGFGGGNVAITSGLATTTGDSQFGTGGPGSNNLANGIAALSQSGNVTINSTTLSTKGLYAAGIYAQADSGTVALTSGSIMTTGAGSAGIFAKAVGATINSTTITTSGGGFAFPGGAGPNGSPLMTDVAPAGTVTADGIDLSVGAGGATVTSGTISILTGDDIAIYGTSGAVKITSGTVSATFGAGITAVTDTGAITISSGSVTSLGTGLDVSAHGAVSISSGTIKSMNTGIFAFGSTLSIANTTRIDATIQGIRAAGGAGGVTITSGIVNISNGGAGLVNNAYADGINATASGGLISITSTDSETTGMLASGIYANNSGGGITINSGTAKGTGTAASGIVALATGNISVTSGIATGNGNPAINAQSSAGTVTINSTTASDIGASPAIYATALGAVSVTAGATSSTLNDGIYASGNGLVTVTSTLINAALQGIRAAGGAGGVTINSGTVTVSNGGAGPVGGVYADGINATASGGSISITSTDSETTGATASGIYANNSGGGVTVNSGTAKGTGSAASGIAAIATGNVSVTSNVATGNGSPAINAQSSGGSVTVTSTTASDTGANPTIYAIGSGSVTISAGTTTATGGTAIYASSNTGTNLNISGNVSSTLGYGVIANGEATINVRSNGSVTGAGGIAVVGLSQSSGTAFLTNFGVITATSAFAVQMTEANSTLQNFGTINGSVNLSGGLSNVFANQGILNGSLTIVGGTGSGVELVQLDSNSTLTGQLKYTVSGGQAGQNGVLQLSGGGTIGGKQISGFQNIGKFGDGRWTITGASGTDPGHWVINQGVISVADISALGISASITIESAGELEVTANTSGAQSIRVDGPGAGINVAAGATYTMGGSLNGLSGTSLYVNGGGGTGELIFGGDNRSTLASDIYVYRGGIYAMVTGAFGTGKVHILDPEIGLADGVEIANDIDLQNTLQVDQTGGTGLLSGTISESVPGSGLTTAGGGTVLLSGANTYTGPTTIGGTLALVGGGSIASSSSVVNNGVFDISMSNGGASIQSLSGSGQVALGAQTLTLTDASDTFAGTISGTGGVTVTGGTETLTGTNTYSGPTTVTGGTLVLDGSLPDSTVVLSNGGSLAGSGFVADVVAAPGSVLSPGGAGIGQLTLDILALDFGSMTSLDIDGPAIGNYDRVLMGAGNIFTAGGQLLVNLRAIATPANNNFTPMVGEHFNVVHADAGVAGSFSGITQPAAGLAAGTQFDALYTATDIDLVVTPASYANLAPLGVTQTANRSGAGAAIDSYRLAPGLRMTGERNTVLAALYSLPAASIGPSLDQIAGSVHGDVLNVALGMNRMFDSAIGDHRGAGDQMLAFIDRLPTGTFAAINTVASPREARLDDASPFWLVGLGSWSHASGDSNAAGYSADAGGVLAGVDLVAEDDKAFGLAVGYAKSDVSTKDTATASVQTERITGYGDVSHGAWRIDGEVAVAVDQYRSKRLIQIGALSRTALGDSNGWAFAADGGVHYDLGFAMPFLEARYDYVSRSGFTETGAGDLSLIVQKQSLDTPRFTAGADFDLDKLADDAPSIFAANLRLAYAHDFKRIDGLADGALAGSPLTGFTALSSRVGLDAGIATLNTSAQIDDALSFFGEYHVEIRSRETSQSVELGLKTEW